MSEPSELERVLAALDAYGRRNGAGVHADAARLLREMAVDFARYGFHKRSCRRWFDEYDQGLEVPSAAGFDCRCGLDAARERWRVKP